MPTQQRVVASDGERDGNISLYGRLQHLQKATGAGRCAAGSNALLCASEQGARHRCVLGSQHYSFGEGLTGARHLHHLATRRGGRAASRWSRRRPTNRSWEEGRAFEEGRERDRAWGTCRA